MTIRSLRRGNTTRWRVLSGLAIFALTVGPASVMASPVSAQVAQSVSGPLYGSLPNVTVHGVPSASVPWVANGHVSFKAGRLTVSAVRLVVAAGYAANGTPVLAKLVGTTDGLRSVTIEVRDATGGSYLTSPVTLSATGSFSFSVPVQLSGVVADPVVLVGTPGPGGTLATWIASSDFLSDFGGSPSTSPTRPVASTSLQAIGPPSVPYCCFAGYSTTSNFGGSTTLTIAGKTYPNGFQLVGDHVGGIFTWHIGGKFHTFSALVGLDETNTSESTFSFPVAIPSNWQNQQTTPKGRPFREDGTGVTQLNVSAGLPIPISLNVTGVQDLIIFVSTTSTLDFANDSLS